MSVMLMVKFGNEFIKSSLFRLRIVRNVRDVH